MRTLAFDVETTGLPSDRLAPDHPDQPHIVQFAALLIDAAGIERACVSLIVRPDGWTIPARAVEVHGITDEIAATVGVPLGAVVAMFDRLARTADRVVAHNLDFDARLVEIAWLRHVKDKLSGYDGRTGDASMTTEAQRDEVERSPATMPDPDAVTQQQLLEHAQAYDNAGTYIGADTAKLLRQAAATITSLQAQLRTVTEERDDYAQAASVEANERRRSHEKIATLTEAVRVLNDTLDEIDHDVSDNDLPVAGDDRLDSAEAAAVANIAHEVCDQVARRIDAVLHHPAVERAAASEPRSGTAEATFAEAVRVLVEAIEHLRKRGVLDVGGGTTKAWAVEQLEAALIHPAVLTALAHISADPEARASDTGTQRPEGAL